MGACGGLVHDHAGVLGVGRVRVAVRGVYGVLVLGWMCWDGWGDISTLTVRWRAGGLVLVVGRGRGGIWATIDRVRGVHGGMGERGRRGRGGGVARIWREGGGEAGGGLARLIANV